MLKEIGTYLQSQGIGTLGADLFLGLMPDQPDNCIALFEYAGGPPDLHWPGEYPGLQVRARNKSYADASTKIGEAMTALHGLHETVLGDTRYLLVKAQGSPEVLKRDNNNRVELFVNFEIIKGGEGGGSSVSSAEKVTVDTSEFNNLISKDANTVQKALNELDQAVTPIDVEDILNLFR